MDSLLCFSPNLSVGIMDFPSLLCEGVPTLVMGQYLKVVQLIVFRVWEPEGIVETVSNLLISQVRKLRPTQGADLLTFPGLDPQNPFMINYDQEQASRLFHPVLPPHNLSCAQPSESKQRGKRRSGLGWDQFPSCTCLIKWKDPISCGIMNYQVESSLEIIWYNPLVL